MKDETRGFDLKKVKTQVKNSDLVKQKHKQIVQAASKLFAEKGYHKTSLRDVSRESGINLSYIYKYISKKDDILYLFYQYITQKLSGFSRKPAGHEFDNPVEELKAFMRNTLEGIRSIQGEALTMYTESRHLEKDSLKVVLEEDSKTVLVIEAIIQRGIKQGYFKTKNAFMAANMVAYMIPFYPLRGWNFKKRCSFDEFVDQSIGFVLDALSVKEEDR